jgi:hypothetical protein
MNSQAFQENLRRYVELKETQDRLNQELYETYAQIRIVEDALSEEKLPGSFPEEFVFSHRGKSYRFLMHIDGGIREFAEMEDFDTWLNQQDAIGETEND